MHNKVVKITVTINEEKCEEVGKIIKNLKLNNQFNNQVKLSEQNLLKAFLIYSACHSINEDKHMAAFNNFISKYPEKFNTDYLKGLTPKEYESWFQGIDEKRIRAEERTEFIRDVCDGLILNYFGSALNFLKACNGKIGGGNGFLKRLNIFKAFCADPVRKKSGALISYLSTCGFVKFDDVENSPPAVDYHITRMLTRLGVIEPGKLLEKMKSKDEFTQDEDDELRLAVSKASKLITKYSGFNPADQSFLLWQIGRSCCARFKVCCNSCKSEKCTFTKQTPNTCENKCLFSDVCDNKEDGLPIREPMIYTTYY